MNEVALFILAGGQSSRMGHDKAFLNLGGRTLLEHALELGRTVTPHVRIVGSREKFSGFGPVVEDVFRDCGPLGGIHAALQASTAELNLMLAVDTPRLQAAFLQYLLQRAAESRALVTVPRAAGGLHPLCAVYRAAFADRAEEALRAGRLRIDRLFLPADTLIVGEEEILRLSFPVTMFENLNTQEEYERARHPAGGSDDGSADSR